MICLALFILITSTLLYLYLHRKTRISLRFLYIDNVAVIILTALITLPLLTLIREWWYYAIITLLAGGLTVGIAFGITMIRFWRTPARKTSPDIHDIVSPADGNIIYIEAVEAGDVPVSVKGNRFSKLEELTKTDILKGQCWLIGINMTPFDVHKNCSPVNGTVILNRHFNGKFLSLKSPEALSENERQTYVISDAANNTRIGIIQTASRLVRRIDSYVQEGQELEKGQWLGMIRFGSQVDLIIPRTCNVLPEIGDQVYAAETVIAKY